MPTYEIDPISRIEGHLGVKVDASGGFIDDAEMHGNLWRGFENFLLGRDVNDAITFTQRICGVCPVPHGQTSAYAVDAVLGYSDGHISFSGDVPAKAVHIRNLVLASEFLMSSLTHFYHLVVLDYVQGPETPPWTPYFDKSFYCDLLLNPTDASYNGVGGVRDASRNILPENDGDANYPFSTSLWDAGIVQYLKALRMRRLTLEAGALFAGRMPMTSCYVGGGVTNDGAENLSSRVSSFKEIMTEVGDFIVKEYVPLVLTLGALYPTYDNSYNSARSPFDNSLNRPAYGAGWGNFLAWGAFPHGDKATSSVSSLACPGGVKILNDVDGSLNAAGGDLSFQVWSKDDVKNNFLDGSNNVADLLTETFYNSHYAISELDTDNIDSTTMIGKPKDVQRTKPSRSRGYSYIKSPRWGGVPCEVGPLARAVVHGLYDVSANTALAVSYGSYYTEYAWIDPAIGASIVGLDARMVGADLAVSLLREGLAVLNTSLDDGVTAITVGKAGGGYDASINDLSGNTIVDAYTFYDASGGGVITRAYITGTVFDWIIGLQAGLSTMDRIRARALESLYLVQVMIGTYDKSGNPDQFGSDGWIDSSTLTNTSAATWTAPGTISANSNYGATEAPRGALLHHATINDQGKITAYQCVVPTTWNASPKDQKGNNGPIEKAIIGAPYSDASSNFVDQSGNTTTGTHSQLEALRIAHTFDPCIACAVH